MDTAQRRVVPGPRSLARAVRLLRLVTSAGDEGLSLTELARRADLPRSTTHRLLTSLAHDGLTEQDDDTGAWMPGPELYLMGTVAASRHDVLDVARDIVRSLADLTQENSYLSVRRGDETVCLIGEEGSYPVRSSAPTIGARAPLGVASAGLAILAFLPRGDIDAFFARHPDLDREWGAEHREPALRRRLDDARRRGVSVNPGLIYADTYGVGAAVFSRDGRPRWALSVTGTGTRFQPDRLPALTRTLLPHAHSLTKRLAAKAR